MVNTKRVLITDLDNTLFDWFDVWYGAFNAMLNAVVELSGVPKDILVPEIKSIHQKYGTSEYSYLLEEIPSLLHKYGDRDKIYSSLDGAIHAYRSERKKRLKLYPTVLETLQELKSKQVKIIGYTESKEYYSNYRVSVLGLDGLIDELYSPADHQIPVSAVKQTKYNLLHTINRHTPENETKPNPEILLDIIRQAGITPDACVYIGDSEMKDIAMAQDAKVMDIFAKYGTGHFDNRIDAYQLLRDVTHWTNEDVEREKKIKESKRKVIPTYIAEQFSDVLKFF
ncbi:HAD family hydrolase [Aeromonas sobria]|nr:HAD family hydrolase [Aeromonas sobria]